MNIKAEAQFSQKNSFLKKLGPGLITGAADDDPSGIATYSQAGAQFGANVLWTVLFTYPLMVGIQIVSARIGRVTGQGLSFNIRSHYPRWILYVIVSLLLFANIVNIAADVSAMGAAVNLVFGGSSQAYAACFGLISLLLQLFIPYSRYVRILKWLTLALLSYVATLFVVKVPWSEVIWSTFFPHWELSANYIAVVVGVFGTTISPYLFFWQAGQEVEDRRLFDPAGKELETTQKTHESFHRIKVDTYFGMGFSNLISFCIILTAAVTLHAQGITDIQTSADAAKALRPLAGDLGFLLFSFGILGTGLLAVPVLAGSSAYAIAEAFDWKERSLELHPLMAKRFYGIIAISTLVGIGLGFTPVDPIRALYMSAIVNGIISVPIMAVMMSMAVKPKIMGAFTIRPRLRFLGWLTVVMMGLAVLAMFWTYFAAGGAIG